MKKNNNFNKFNTFRNDFKYFIFEKYDIVILPESLNISFHFNLSDKFFFHPTLTIPKKKFYNLNSFSSADLENIVFHIGMIELLSYWKAACSPKIIIKPFAINEEQIRWWKKIYFNGLGEFFYLNSIETTIEDFVEIVSDSDKIIKKQNFKLDDSTIIPIGGGKDSIVTLELLNELNKKNTSFILNHRGASLKTIEKIGFSMDESIEFYRTIDPELLKLNEKGFLNGHTPFSALLAFNTILAAIISGKKNIALSNESSANEPTVEGANHQYSKSFEFENDFRKYVHEYISEEINYYSFLRPLSELQIAMLFSEQSKYFDIFKSCNVGSKTNSWCDKCPKCLFTYIILSPFIEPQRLEEIFGKNLLNDKNLLIYFKELIGLETEKPFDCIGTVDEVNIALCMTIKQWKDDDLPFLLKYFKESDNYQTYKKTDTQTFLSNIQTEHFLSPEQINYLKNKLDERATGEINRR